LLPTPKKANYSTTEALLEEIPQLKEYSGINFQFNGDKALIRVRKKGLNKKPLLYLWDITRGCYLSSLYPKRGYFIFEVKGLWYRLVFSEGMPQVTAQTQRKAS
jgi:hypothetical protein